MASTRLYIGNKCYSSWSLRPWILMRAFEVPFEEVLVSVSGGGVHAGLHRDYSPSGLVPSLQVDAIVVWDSLAIAEYLAESHSKMWPTDRNARAFARCVCAEMHSGFGDVRGRMPMNIKLRLVGKQPTKEVQANIERIEQIWVASRKDFGEAAGGAFLFGTFGIADAMFAPVCWRFFTYNVVPTDPRARAYLAAMLQHPLMREWESAALGEGLPGSTGPAPLAHYDEQALGLGGAERAPENSSVEAFVAGLLAA